MVRNLTACSDSPCPVLDPFGKTSSATEVKKSLVSFLLEGKDMTVLFTILLDSFLFLEAPLVML